MQKSLRWTLNSNKFYPRTCKDTLWAALQGAKTVIELKTSQYRAITIRIVFGWTNFLPFSFLNANYKCLRFLSVSSHSAWIRKYWRKIKQAYHPRDKNHSWKGSDEERRRRAPITRLSKRNRKRYPQLCFSSTEIWNSHRWNWAISFPKSNWTVKLYAKWLGYSQSWRRRHQFRAKHVYFAKFDYRLFYFVFLKPQKSHLSAENRQNHEFHLVTKFSNRQVHCNAKILPLIWYRFPEVADLLFRRSRSYAVGCEKNNYDTWIQPKALSKLKTITESSTTVFSRIVHLSSENRPEQENWPNRKWFWILKLQIADLQPDISTNQALSLGREQLVWDFQDVNLVSM